MLVADGWEIVRPTAHGLWLKKRFKSGTRFATVKDTKARLPPGTLAAILGPRQTGLGKKGLNDLIGRHG